MTVDASVVERVRARLALEGGDPTAVRVAAALRAEAGVAGDGVLLELLATFRSEITGAGPLEPLLHDPAVTDVLVNAPSEVWVDRGEGLERADVRFPDDRAVRRLAQRLAGAT
ncbi:MAG TPA: ATPase, partial [Mycobacteriales bacterium]|nr:ATPase [Mycobacteriales bacterium]